MKYPVIIFISLLYKYIIYNTILLTIKEQSCSQNAREDVVGLEKKFMAGFSRTSQREWPVHFLAWAALSSASSAWK